jgi:hypothetical protein
MTYMTLVQAITARFWRFAARIGMSGQMRDTKTLYNIE